MPSLLLKGKDLTIERVRAEVEKRIAMGDKYVRVLFASTNKRIESKLTIQKNNSGISNVYDMRNMESPLSLKGVDSIESI